MNEEAVIHNWRRVRAKIDHAAQEAGRDPHHIRLVSVSKFHPLSACLPLLKEGVRVFGENRVQEAYAKWSDVRPTYLDLCLHLLGPLQSNKVREAVALFDVIESVDRPKIAQALAQEMRRVQKFPRLFVEVNVGNEPQKAGVLPQDLNDFLRLCTQEYGLFIEGLMCIPPLHHQPSPYFAFLAKLATEHHITSLSMGMSADFTQAIALGATHVRVGTAIFGEREKDDTTL